MPLIQSQIIPVGQDPLNSPFPTHEDIYGKGGYVVVKTTTELPYIQDHIIPSRRKEGMLVYDITADKFYQCVSVNDGTGNEYWPEIDLIGSGTNGTGATALSELTDVTLSTLEADNILIYNIGTEKWENVDLLEHFNFPVDTNGNLDLATETSIQYLIDIVNNLNVIADIQAGTGISVSTDSENVSTITLNATLGQLNLVDNAVDSLGPDGNNWVLKWNATSQQWIAGPVSVTVEGSTDSVFAQIDEPYVTWMNARTDLTNSLAIGDILVGGEGILIDPTTDHTLTFSIDQNVVVLYEDMPKYTDGSLDVARQSTLESLVDLLNSFGTTDCPVGGGGILGITEGTNIDITGPAAFPIVSLSSTVTNTTFTNSTYNELEIQRPPTTNDLLLTYPDSNTQPNISIRFAENFSATFSTTAPDTNIEFRNLNTNEKNYIHQVAYVEELYISKLRDVVITTDLVPGSILTYVVDNNEEYWTNTNEISGGNASSF